MQMPLVGALSLGLVAGLQWLVLRRYLVELRWFSWVGAAVAGYLAALVCMALAAAASLILGTRLVDLIGLSALRLLTVIVLGGLIGAVVGFAQWLVLRRHLTASVWWIPATFLAWVVVALLTPTSLVFHDSTTAAQLMSQVISGLVIGSITGMTLILLLRKSREAHLTHRPRMQ